MALAGPATTLVESDGATLPPGFFDAHGHFMNAPQIISWVNVSGPPVGSMTSIADIVTAIRGFRDERRPAPGDWAIGYGHDAGVLSDGRELTRDDLDPHLPDNPIMPIHGSNHGCALNSAGFALTGIDAGAATPEGGVILRREGGNEPAGLLMETAFLPIFANMPQPGRAELPELLPAAQEICTSRGVTTAQEGATRRQDLEFLLRAADAGRLVIDVASLPIIFDVPALAREYAPDFGGVATWRSIRSSSGPTSSTSMSSSA